MLNKMLQQLTDKEKQALITHFRLADQPGSREETISMDMLLEQTFLEKYLNQLQHKFGTDSQFVAGSQLMKRIGFVMATPFLYTMTAYHKCLPLELENCFLVSSYKAGKWLPNLYIKDVTVEKINEENREKQRAELINKLFNHIYQLINHISKVSKVPRPILWENVAIYIYWLYETKMPMELRGMDQKMIVNDFHYLVREADASVFQESYNPLARFYNDKREVEGVDEPVRIRRTCCFFYETGENESFCSTCPKSRVNKEACLATKRTLSGQNVWK
ncbi:IucA/IucC family C-terminal-domain containing protein [Oceanobacillus salinisoli]|uniref:IucA/IucC family C-terminal-domain containing protein n=1 Tax=Oceanobacillus salinisoli TaxID=2678611 RepID=UPI0012E327CD|nr:IucA/IucC family C-terminal-domain containing protein [Oceanobacillus salinisoli]